MDDRKRQPEPSQETSPTVFARPHRRGDGNRPDRAPPQFAAGAQLGKYRIVKHLGAGGMGAVYEAVHTEIGKEVALKVLSRELATDPRAQARFLREALAASRLDHPHVVNVTDYASEGDVAYLVMELLRGEDLGAYLDRNPQGLFVEEAVDILIAVCAGVFAAHELGVVHRDIKPRNIFLARNHMREIEPTVLDFGISKVDDGPVDQSLTDSGVIVGTVQYVSPEHVRGAPTDARSDQYALGVVLYECLTGRLPHEGKTSYALLQNIAEGRFPPPSAVRAGIPAALEQRLLRAMSTDPAERFATVYALGQALLDFASAKRRVMWAEYFGRPEALAPSGPPTRTSPIAIPQGLAKPTEPPPKRTRPAETETHSPAARGKPAETIYREAPVSPARSSRRRGVLGVVALLVLAGAGWAVVRGGDLPAWMRTTPPTASLEPTQEQAPVPAPKAPAPSSRARTGNESASPAVVSPPAPGQPSATERTETSAPVAAPATVALQVVSQPAGALVFLDDDETSVGRTPVTLKLPRSEQPRVLWLRLPRHRDVSRAVILDRDQSITLDLPRLAKRPPRPSPAAEEPAPQGRYQKLEE
ncbi:MAG TPA: protein kinase [Polyangia bacterium]